MSEKQIIRLSRTPEGFGNTADELTAEMFESELPIQHSHSYFEDDELGLYIGVWDTTDMVEVAGPYGCDEFMIVLEGQAAIKNTSTGEVETVAAGEGFVIAKGYECQWQQQGYLRKFYVISEHPQEPIPEQPAANGIIKMQAQQASPDNRAEKLEVELTGDSFELKTPTKVNKGQHLYQDNLGRFVAGIWQSDAFETKLQPFPRHEFIYVQSGQLTCIDEHQQAHIFNAGDAFFIPKGTVCQWQVKDNVRTYYTIIQ